jgi:hypothetical protein
MTFHGSSPTVNNGGTGYTVGDVLTVVGGTPTASAATVTVTAVSGGVITGANHSAFNSYSVLPSVPYSVTGGTGSGATFTSTWQLGILFTITNAGSGYVEQPTVTFSGGGGSGAAAYATVGSGTIVRSLGAPLSFYTPAGEQVRVSDSGNTPDAYLSLKGGSSSSGGVYVTAAGTARSLYLSSGAGTSIRTYTGGEGTNEQLRVSHTASAVNYVQVTGAATGSGPTLSAQGSDANIQMIYASKGGFGHLFKTSGNTNQFSIAHIASTANFPEVVGAVTGSSPVFRVAGSDTNIDLTLTPKGTGVIQFGTYTASILTPTGYITVKDSGGTTRRLLVG